MSSSDLVRTVSVWVASPPGTSGIADSVCYGRKLINGYNNGYTEHFNLQICNKFIFLFVSGEIMAQNHRDDEIDVFCISRRVNALVIEIKNAST